jgi:hypothetical protein
VPDLSLPSFLVRLRDRLGWPLLSVIGAGLLILLVLAFTPGRDTMAAPSPQAELAPAAAKRSTETPALGEPASDAPQKPSPAIPKKKRRR